MAMDWRISFQRTLMGLFGMAFLMCGSAFGQETRATLSGTVTDPSGAAVAGAHLQLLNVQTGVQSRTESGQTGQYRFLFVNPGTYRLTFEMQGFRSLVREGVMLRSEEHTS